MSLGPIPGTGKIFPASVLTLNHAVAEVARCSASAGTSRRVLERPRRWTVSDAEAAADADDDESPPPPLELPTDWSSNV